MRARPRRQRDLFEEEQPTAQVPTTLKATLVRRISELLVEAIGDPMHVETSFVRNLGGLTRVRHGMPAHEGDGRR
jgi:hypothetical protein